MGSSNKFAYRKYKTGGIFPTRSQAEEESGELLSAHLTDLVGGNIGN